MRKDEEQEYSELLKLAFENDAKFFDWEKRNLKYTGIFEYDGRDGGDPDPVPEAPIAHKVEGEILKTKRAAAWTSVRKFKKSLGIDLE